MSRSSFSGSVQSADLRLLRVFMAVVEAGGFSAAEVRLGISRSAISKHMADLEGRLGLKLCLRGRAGFDLTESGKEVYEAFETLLQSIDDFKGKINRLHSELRGSIHIGVVDNTISDSANPLISAIRRMSVQSPQVEINISIMSSSTMETALLEDTIHIGMNTRRHVKREQLVYKEMYTEVSKLYCGKGHPLYSRHKPDNSILSEQRFVSPSPYELDRLKEVLGEGINITSAVARNVEGTAMFLLTGQYLGFLPDHIAYSFEAADKIRSISADIFTIHTPMEIIYKLRRETNPILESFLNELFA